MLQSLLKFIPAFAVLAGMAHAAMPGEMLTTVQWRMSLDADGHITALVPRGDAVEAIRQPLEQAIRRWEFVPGKLDGVPAATETLLSVQVALASSADGAQFTVKLRDVRTGGFVADAKEPPRIPAGELGKMARTGVKFAQVAVEVDYDGYGKLVDITVSPGSGVQKGPLVDAIRKAMHKWAFEPERVAGNGVPGKLVTSICFTLARSKAEAQQLASACRWTLPGSDAALDEGQSLALDSQVRLKTDVFSGVL